MEEDGTQVASWDTEDFDMSKTNHVFCLGQEIAKALDERELDRECATVAHG